MTVESTTQAICDLALRFGEGEEESMVRLCYSYSINAMTTSLAHLKTMGNTITSRILLFFLFRLCLKLINTVSLFDGCMLPVQ
jgi:hypothetical protein